MVRMLAALVLLCSGSVAAGAEQRIELVKHNDTIKVQSNTFRSNPHLRPGDQIRVMYSKDVSGVTLQLPRGTPLPASDETSAGSVYAVPNITAGETEVVLLHNGDEIESYDVAVQPNRETPPVSSPGLLALIGTPIHRDDIHGKLDDIEGRYDRPGNRAEFIVSLLGTVLEAPVESIDENDLVHVTIMADTDLHPYLRVKRTSPIRQTGGLTIIGSGENLQSVIQHADRAVPARRSMPFSVALRDFAPGRAAVTISLRLPDKELELGSFEFVVNPLYHGMFSYGPVWSRRTSEGFVLVPKDTAQVIAEANSGDDSIEQVLFYTAFLKRVDVEKTRIPRDSGLLDHVGLTMGLVLAEDIEDHALVGLSAHALGFLASAGVHFVRATELNPTSGLEVGSPFTEPGAAIPTVQEWTAEWFVGITVDLRAAVALLKAAFRSPS